MMFSNVGNMGLRLGVYDNVTGEMLAEVLGKSTIIIFGFFEFVFFGRVSMGVYVFIHIIVLLGLHSQCDCSVNTSSYDNDIFYIILSHPR